MFDPNSRYYTIETATLTTLAGREVRYIRRRFLPQAPSTSPVVEHTVKQGERLDAITARYLGDPLLFWQLCDVNNAMQPEELTAEPGSTIKITLLQA